RWLSVRRTVRGRARVGAASPSTTSETTCRATALGQQDGQGARRITWTQAGSRAGRRRCEERAPPTCRSTRPRRELRGALRTTAELRAPRQSAPPAPGAPPAATPAPIRHSPNGIPPP